MGGTKAGAEAMRQTMIAKYGSEEAWRARMGQLGSEGGKAKVPKGFALMSPEKRSEVGRKGGRVTKRKEQEAPSSEHGQPTI